MTILTIKTKSDDPAKYDNEIDWRGANMWYFEVETVTDATIADVVGELAQKTRFTHFRVWRMDRPILDSLVASGEWDRITTNLDKMDK